MSNKKLRKILKITGIVVGALILILIPVIIYVNHNISDIADGYVRKAFEKSPLSKVYTMNYEKLTVNILSGNLELHQFTLVPKPEFYKSDDSLRLANPMVIEAVVPAFIIKGLDIKGDINFLDFSNISLKAVRIDDPQIKVIDHLTQAEKLKRKRFVEMQHADTIKKESGVESISIGNFKLKNGKFEFYDYRKKKNVFQVGSASISLDDVLLKTDSIKNTLLKPTFKNSNIQVKDVYYPLPNGFYDIRLGKLELKIEQHKLKLYDFQLIPKYDKEAFGKAFGWQTDRFDVKVKKIEVVDVNIRKLLEENAVEIAKIVVTGVDADIYRDKNIPRDYSKFPKFPHQALGDVKTDLNIGKVEIKKSKLVYEELAPKASVAGKVPISNLYATIYNVTNNPEVIAKNGPLKWDVMGDFFDAGKLSVVIDFSEDLNKPAFIFSGKLGKMDMTAFNQMIKPNAHLEITSGKLRSLEFNAVANDDYSSGNLLMIYDDLKMEILKEFTDEGEKTSGFINALANAVVKSGNPGKNSDKAPKSAEIFFERNKNKAIFNYLAQSLINGVKATLIPKLAMTKEKWERQKQKEANKNERQQQKKDKVDKKQQDKDAKNDMKKKMPFWKKKK